MNEQGYLEMPWSMEDTIENLKQIKEIMIAKVRSVHLDGKAESDEKEVAFDFDRAIKALEEIQQYRELGTVEELKAMMDNGAFTGTELAQIAAMQMKLKEYQQLGTVEELRDAREKQIPKKPIWEKGVCYAMTKDGKERREMIPKCPSCLSRELIYGYPCKCGQKLDFSEE